MNCRQFKSKHVGYVDDLLCAADMAEMRRHIQGCFKCAELDTRIRRSLLIVRNLPQIEPSADFFARLSESLERAPAAPARQQPLMTIATFAAVSAALAAAVYFAMAFAPDGSHPAAPTEPAAATMARAPMQLMPMNEVAFASTVPAGVPVWPAMFMVGELPAHFSNAELLEASLGR